MTKSPTDDPLIDDPLIDALSDLPRVPCDASHADLHRARCRARLTQSADAPRPNLIAEPAGVGAVCATYAWYIAHVLIW